MMQANNANNTHTTTAEVQKAHTTTSTSSSNPTVFSLASGTAASPSATEAGMHPVASMATTVSVTGSSSGRSMDSTTDHEDHVGLPLDSTTDEDSHNSHPTNNHDGDEWNSPCARGSKCLQLQQQQLVDPTQLENGDHVVTIASSHQNRKDNTSCVDCGGCACCCCCFVDEPQDDVNSTGTSTNRFIKSPSQRAYSIKLGQAQGKMLEELFGPDAKSQRQQQRQQHLSSSALTVVQGGDMSSSSHLTAMGDAGSKEFYVKRLAFDNSSCDSDEQSLHLKQHKGPFFSYCVCGSVCLCSILYVYSLSLDSVS